MWGRPPRPSVFHHGGTEEDRNNERGMASAVPFFVFQIGTGAEIFLPFVLRHTRILHTIESAQDGGCGGCCQWVLAAACEAVEWPSQPLGFESLALRTVTRRYR